MRKLHSTIMPRGNNELTTTKQEITEMLICKDAIRSKYFHSLGLFESLPNASPSLPDSANPSPQAYSEEMLLFEPLKHDNGRTSMSDDSKVAEPPFSFACNPSSRSLLSSSSILSCDSSSSDSESSKDKRRERSVSFDTTVTVKPIPKHQEYSDRIKGRLWHDPQETRKNVQRNAVEFASENHNWELSLEDHEMYTHAATGEKIHPIHVHCLLERRRLAEQQKSTKEDTFLNISRRAARQWTLENEYKHHQCVF